MLGHELTTRLELIKDEPEHPHAMHEYYKVQIGPLIELKNPILADDWRRITFLYTTGELLLSARSFNDLMVGSEARQILWRALYDRAIHADDYRIEDMPDLELSSDALDSLLGLYQIKKGNN